jgi:hypothetical protein
MERSPTDPPRARADRARHWLALVADAAFLVASLFLLYTALGGKVRGAWPKMSTRSPVATSSRVLLNSRHVP